jgi:GNAT superfamily N-acetyltransferase
MIQAHCRLATAADLPVIRQLFQEYADALGFDLSFQNFAEELAELPGLYAPPGGCLLLATVADQPAGCVALRPLLGDVCEMKRLYVRPEFRGSGLGHLLASRISDEARALSYHRMRLDTIPARMAGAVALYQGLGFEAIPAYCDNPIPGALFMELRLRQDP